MQFLLLKTDAFLSVLSVFLHRACSRNVTCLFLYRKHEKEIEKTDENALDFVLMELETKSLDEKVYRYRRFGESQQCITWWISG